MDTQQRTRQVLRKRANQFYRNRNGNFTNGDRQAVLMFASPDAPNNDRSPRRSSHLTERHQITRFSQPIPTRNPLRQGRFRCPLAEANYSFRRDTATARDNCFSRTPIRSICGGNCIENPGKHTNDPVNEGHAVEITEGASPPEETKPTPGSPLLAGRPPKLVLFVRHCASCPMLMSSKL